MLGEKNYLPSRKSLTSGQKNWKGGRGRVGEGGGGGEGGGCANTLRKSPAVWKIAHFVIARFESSIFTFYTLTHKGLCCGGQINKMINFQADIVQAIH